jgi:hypothetical protein
MIEYPQLCVLTLLQLLAAGFRTHATSQTCCLMTAH